MTTQQSVSILETKLRERTAKVVVVGLGYVGLPLAVEVAHAGLHVTGLEISERKVQLVSSGRSDIDDISDATLAPLVKSGKLAASLDPAVIKDADCVAICVPTPLSKTKDPDVSFILSAVDSVEKHLHRDMLVVLESTTYPGTTEELIRPRLEASGMKVGVDFYLAFSPERVDPGNAKWGTKNTPRIVGGTTPACSRMAAAFYGLFLDKVVAVSSTQAAEMVKLLENTFRSVNIGLVNEVALMCDRLNLDVWEIIEAAATKPFGFMPFYPGPGLGGHCIPIDPHYLSWKLKSLNYYARFIELAGDINSHMPEYVVDRIARALNEDSKSIKGADILVLGVAYKRDISDVRESPSLDVIRLLQVRGAKVSYADPHVAAVRMDDTIMEAVPLSDAALKSADSVVILTDHTTYDYQHICATSRMVMDCRNATKNVPKGVGRVWKL
ncbi:MAG: nucleotide sugar dehydrogenase [candidate division Zixibacteria bacterium]|nr:nucleotide sugar dehydrogenase [candidate division Zixibacteria bacterium]